MKDDLPEFTAALKRGENFCGANPPAYRDWKQPPHESIAQDGCLPCPMYFICEANANHIKPHWGTWAGVPWVAGRPAHSIPVDELAALLSED